MRHLSLPVTGHRKLRNCHLKLRIFHINVGAQKFMIVSPFVDDARAGYGRASDALATGLRPS
jgi:hypothetical protein